MCGISGIWSTNKEDKNDLLYSQELISSAISHRGPDNQGFWINDANSLILSHSRLSIQDLSVAGHQPMFSRSGRFLITYNGEIYNHYELREEINKELNNQLHWRGRSDTETLIEAIELWGLDKTLNKTRGMFAFCLWDQEKNQIYIVRDRFGEKPLYWGFIKSTHIRSLSFIFSSDIKAIRSMIGKSFKIDIDAFLSYLQFGCIQQPLSIFDGIRQLLPGECLTLKANEFGFCNRESLSIHNWEKPINNLATDKFQDQILRLENSLKESVALQTISDVPIGAFLSGGIDSSLIVALLQNQSSRPVNTFTIAFPDYGSREQYFDESSYATAISGHLNTNHQNIPLTIKDLIEETKNISSIYSEPFSDSSQIPSHIICKKVSQSGINVALAGDGGDELFGGYYRHFLASSIENLNRKIPYSLRCIFSTILLNTPSYITRENSKKIIKLSNAIRCNSDPLELYLALASTFHNPLSLLNKDKFSELQYKNKIDFSYLDSLEESFMKTDLKNYMLSDTLVKMDRASMATGLEVRSPFLDREVSHIAQSLPLDLKIKKTNSKLISKYILRKILYKYVPQNLIDRPKKGFSIPLAQWLRGPLRNWADELLDPALICSQELLNASCVKILWEDHLSGKKDNSNIIWSILMWQSWYYSNDY